MSKAESVLQDWLHWPRTGCLLPQTKNKKMKRLREVTMRGKILSRIESGRNSTTSSPTAKSRKTNNQMVRRSRRTHRVSGKTKLTSTT